MASTWQGRVHPQPAPGRPLSWIAYPVESPVAANVGESGLICPVLIADNRPYLNRRWLLL
jgi:hypothetical protein